MRKENPKISTLTYIDLIEVLKHEPYQIIVIVSCATVGMECHDVKEQYRAEHVAFILKAVSLWPIFAG